MKQKIFVALTAVILSGAAVADAQVVHAQITPRRPEPVQRPVVHERPVVREQPTHVEHSAPERHVERESERRSERRSEPEVRPERRSEPEVRPERRFEPEHRTERRYEPEYRTRPSASRPSTVVYRPAIITAGMRRAMTYNTRPGGVHIRPEYFVTHYGREHGFHLEAGFRLYGGEYYFSWNGGWFGVMGTVPDNWALHRDYLYIDLGDDGNYYLYNAQDPDFAVQLTFVQNVGDDQVDTDQDQ
jgi:hypothetical protein